MTDPHGVLPTRREYSGAAVLGIGALGLGILLSALPVVALVLGVLSVVLGARSRAQLKADPELRGVGASVVAFFGGLVLVTVHAVPFIIGLAFAYLGPTLSAAMT